MTSRRAPNAGGGMTALGGGGSSNALNGGGGETSSSYFASILAQPPPLASFDAFNKQAAVYKERTTRGGILTVVIAIIVCLLVWTESKEYLYGEPDYEFSVDKGIGKDLQINFDATVATPCHCAFWSLAAQYIKRGADLNSCDRLDSRCERCSWGQTAHLG